MPAFVDARVLLRCNARRSYLTLQRSQSPFGVLDQVPAGSSISSPPTYSQHSDAPADNVLASKVRLPLREVPSFGFGQVVELVYRCVGRREHVLVEGLLCETSRGVSTGEIAVRSACEARVSVRAGEVEEDACPSGP